MAKLFNLARMTTATTGTGTISLGVAAAGYLTFATAGVANADVISYAIEDGSNREVGTGTYTTAGLTLTRTVITSTNANAAISLSGSAQVFITISNRDVFDQGTKVAFQQTNAPSGWTKDTTHNDKALRVVSGAASSGGTNSFSTVMAQTTVGNTTPTLATTFAHGHSYTAPGSAFNVEQFAIIAASAAGPPSGSTTGSQGSSSAHNHTITMAMQYVDIIIATKD